MFRPPKIDTIGGEGGRPYQGDVTGLWWVAAIREPVAAQEQGALPL